MNYGSVRIVTGDVSQGIVKGMERISNYTLTRHFNRIKNKVYYDIRKSSSMKMRSRACSDCT
jgi:predicted RNA-binding protein with PIN domain